MPTYNNGSNSNLDSDGKCALVLMPVEAMEAPQAFESRQIVVMQHRQEELKTRVPVK